MRRHVGGGTLLEEVSVGDPLYGAVLGFGVVYQGSYGFDLSEETVAAFRSVGLDPSTADLTDVIRRKIGLTAEEEDEYHKMWSDDDDKRRMRRIATMTARIAELTLARYGVEGFDETYCGDDDGGVTLLTPRGAIVSASGYDPVEAGRLGGSNPLAWSLACQMIAEDIPGGRGPALWLIART